MQPINVILQRLIDRHDLDMAGTMAVFDEIMSGKCQPSQIAGLLVALRMKGETVEELAGAASSMRRHAVFVDTGGRQTVDTCGTGADGASTFNISTTAAIIVAGAGVPVAKHGNRSITSQCGSADVLKALGVNIETPSDVTETCIQEAGIGFLFAPSLHPAMRHAAPIRKELGVRTIFNMLGPLTNPAGAQGQVLGVFAPELTEMFANVLRLLGSQRVFVVHGNDGLDEITTTTTTRISELRGGRVLTYEFDPLPLLTQYASPADLKGGDPATNAAITKTILDGQQGAPRDIACINAAAAIVAGGKAPDINAGFILAQESIDSGRARAALAKLVETSNQK